MEAIATTLQPVPTARPLSPALAVLLSALPGLGQVYLGQVQQGFLHIAVVGSLIALLNMGMGALEPLLGLLLAFMWLFSMIDAGRRASHHNAVLAGQPIPLVNASKENRVALLATGILLTLTGTLSFFHSILGWSMAWITRWWPLGLVALGIGMVVYGYKQFQPTEDLSAE